jgi:hypothetical protein
MQVSCYSSSPYGQGTTSSFYRPRGGGLQSCRTVLSATCGNMMHSVVELTVVQANRASGGHRRGSCARPGAASRVVAGALAWSSSVRRFEGSADSRSEAAQRRVWQCAVDLGSHSARDDAVVPGMAAQWRGDGRTRPEVTGETHPAGLTSRRRPRWV